MLQSGTPLDLPLILSAAQLVDWIGWPVAFFGCFMNEVTNCRLSFSRIQTFLCQAELEPVKRVKKPFAVKLTGDFKWKSEVTLSAIDLEIAKGELVCVVGEVGSGKSSLLRAILGEMGGGDVLLDGTTALIESPAWLQNMSVQDNILFGKPMGPRYSSTIKACSLTEISDQTMVGERGNTLSGGQKARISLARGVYQNSDIYLLDDPLSSVDYSTRKTLF